MKLVSNLDLLAILQEANRLPYFRDSTGVEMARRQSDPLPDLRPYPFIRAAILEVSQSRGLEPLHMMLNRMAPGVSVPFHQDWLAPTPKQGKYPCLERWHLPLITNPGAAFSYRGGEPEHFEAGYWHGPIRYWEHHSVCNMGETERVHLVVDLDSERLGDYQ